MTSTAVTDERTLRLRFMIESWARDGLVRPAVAAQALAPVLERTAPIAEPPTRRRGLEVLGYIGAAPVAAVGLLLVDSRAGIGSLLLVGLLIAIASPRALRLGPARVAGAWSHRTAPRHRATHPVDPVQSCPPMSHEFVQN